MAPDDVPILPELLTRLLTGEIEARVHSMDAEQLNLQTTYAAVGSKDFLQGVFIRRMRHHQAQLQRIKADSAGLLTPTFAQQIVPMLEKAIDRANQHVAYWEALAAPLTTTPAGRSRSSTEAPPADLLKSMDLRVKADQAHRRWAQTAMKPWPKIITSAPAEPARVSSDYRRYEPSSLGRANETDQERKDRERHEAEIKFAKDYADMLARHGKKMTEIRTKAQDDIQRIRFRGLGGSSY